MSVHVLSWAWKQNVGQSQAKLVLVKLAEQSNDDGECWPSMRTIARDCEFGERSAMRWIRHLEELGLVTAVARHDERGRQTSNLYRLSFQEGEGDTVDTLPPSAMSTSGATQLTPSREEPLKEPSEELASPRNGRQRNPVWDALTEVFGEPSTDTARTLRGKICSSLTRAGATPDELVTRAKSWPRHFEDATLTETALEKHWDKLGRPPLRVSR